VVLSTGKCIRYLLANPANPAPHLTRV